MMNLLGGGATSRLIASLLDSIQELESKLDFSLLSSLQSEVPAQSLQESETLSLSLRGETPSPSLRGSEATEAIHTQTIDNTQPNGLPRSLTTSRNDKKEKMDYHNLPYDKSHKQNIVDCHDFTTQNLAMTGLDFQALLASLPTPTKHGWEKVKLSNVCRINEKTYNPSNEADKEYIYIDIDSVEKGTGKFSTDNKLLASNLPTRARRLADDDSVIISTVRPYLKGFAYIRESIKDSIFSTGFAILKGNERLKSKFIYILFMFSNDLMKQMEEKMPKASYPSINADDIKAFQIPLPPLEAQEKIVSAIEKLESKIHLLDSSLSHLDSKKSKILQHFLEA